MFALSSDFTLESRLDSWDRASFISQGMPMSTRCRPGAGCQTRQNVAFLFGEKDNIPKHAANDHIKSQAQNLASLGSHQFLARPIFFAHHRCRQPCGFTSADKCDGLLALDINGTIVQGDSYKDKDSLELQADAKRLLTDFEARFPRGRVVLYTFGKDFPNAVDQLKQMHVTFKEKHYFLIAKEKAAGQIWAFPIKSKVPELSEIEEINSGGPLLRYYDKNGFAEPILMPQPSDDPATEDEYQEKVDEYKREVNKYAITAEVTEDNLNEKITQINTLGSDDRGPLRFKDKNLFRKFIDTLLDGGNNLMLRAYFGENSKEYFADQVFQPRAEGKSQNKILATGKITFGFDDNPGDWDVSGCTNKTAVYRVVLGDGPWTGACTQWSHDWSDVFPKADLKKK